MNRKGAIVLVGLATLLGGCRDLGLAGNIPAEESRRADPPPLVADVMRPAPGGDTQLVMDGRLWVPTGHPVALPVTELRPVGSAMGQTVYARWWDDRPFRAIFIQAIVHPQSAREALHATRQHWQEFAPVIGRRGQAGLLDPARQPAPGP
jgi:hypothetical protein